MVGCETLHVGGVVGQFTVTVDCTLHVAVLGNWIDSALCPDAASCTGRRAAPAATVAVASSVLPSLNSSNTLPAGALVVIATVDWKPSMQVAVVSVTSANVAPSIAA